MGQKVNLLKSNFSAGEVSPLMHGRVDVARHKNGAAELMNFVVQPHGGIARRMGSQYLATTKNSATKKATLIPFQFSDDQSYMLEFGEYYIRIFDEGVPLMDGPDILEVVTPYTEADLEGISYCQSADVLYLAHPNHYPKTLARFAVNDWRFASLQHFDGPYRSSVPNDQQITLQLTSIVHRATLKSTANDFSALSVGKFVEYYSDGLLTIGKVITYVNATTVTIEPKENVVDFAAIDPQAVIYWVTGKIGASLSIWSSETEYSYIKVLSTWYYMTTHKAGPELISGVSSDVMYTDESVGVAPVIQTTTGYISVSGETITATLVSSVDLFATPRDVLRQFRMTFGANNVWGSIASVSNSKTASVLLGVPVPTNKRNRLVYINNATTTTWKMGAWYVGNYPSLCTIHQQRLIFANTLFESNRVWFSEIDDFVSFATANRFAEVIDSSGLNISVGTGEVNPITWLQSGPVLLVGTAGEEFQIKPSSISEALSPTNISITQQTSYGGRKNIRPIKIGSATLFVQRHGHNIREMVYSFELDSFTASDTTIISEHILRVNGTASMIAFQQIPYATLWVLCTNGKLVSFTYEKEHQVYAWAQHEINGVVEAIASIPSSGQRDDLYLIVKRTIDGATTRYFEKFAPIFQPASDVDYSGMAFMDSFIEFVPEFNAISDLQVDGLSYAGAPVNVPDLYYIWDELGSPWHRSFNFTSTLKKEVPKASGTLAPAGVNNDIFIEATTGGVAGNSITVEIEIFNPASPNPFLKVTGTDILVTTLNTSKARMTVSNAGTSAANGDYYPYAIVGGYYQWSKDGLNSYPQINGVPGTWNLELSAISYGYIATDAVDYPSDVFADWTAIDGALPLPIVTNSPITIPQIIYAINDDIATSALIIASNAVGSDGSGVVAIASSMLSGGSNTERWNLTVGSMIWLSASTEVYPWDVLPQDWVGQGDAEGYPIFTPRTQTITGLDHLEGEEVSILGNYAVHPVRTVVGGEVEVSYPIAHAFVGLNYTSRLKTLAEEGGSPTGTSQGKLKKIVRVDAQLLDSVGLKYGITEPTSEHPMSFAISPVHGSPPKLFTGFKELYDDSGFEKNQQFYIVQDQPYPLNILSLSQVVVVNE